MPNDCPVASELLAYTMGKLPHDRCEQIDGHLEECPSCQAELETCGNADDTFLSRLKTEEASRPYLAEAECADALARVAAIGQEPSFTTQRQLAEPPSADTSLGNIGPYRLLEKLGAGGMGTVYKAFHPKLKRVVALKMLPAERTDDQQAIQRFEREMEAVGKLDHPNIVRATDAGEHDDKHFLVMEFVDGVDLSELSRRVGPLPIAEACELIRQAAIGLQHAHENGLVHRDIKPSNLMLTSDANVKILDLGLALLPEQVEGSELTSTGQAMGTLDYMAPEQGGDSHDVDIRADIYALGATLYKLLTGQAIYAGPNYKTIMDKWRALATEDPTPIQQRRPEVPDDLAAVVHRMLAREVEDRFAVPQEVAQALAPFCDGADLAVLAAGPETTPPDEVSQSTTSLLKEAASFDTSPRQPNSADLAPTQPDVAKEDPAGATAGLPNSAQAKPQVAARRKKPNILLIAGGLLGIVAVLAAMVFYFQTPKGTLRVEIDDPKIKVEIKGEDIVLTNADKRPIKLTAGEHTLIVTRGDFTFETKQLTLKKGETTTVQVELLPGKVQVVSAGKILSSQLLASSNGTTQKPALLFDGETSYVDIRTLRFDGTHPLTLEAYITPNRKQGNAGVIGDHWDTGVTLRTDSENRWGFTVGPRAEPDRAMPDSQLTVGQRVHIAATWDKDRLRLFVDGKEVASAASTDRVYQPSRRWFAIGRYVAGGGHFSGIIDEVRISDVTRYSDDFKPLEGFKPDQHTLALYHFDEGSGDMLHDSSGNGHHGKIVGAKWVRVPHTDSIADPDRRAAEWVRSINTHHFTYIVIRQNGEERTIGHEELKSENALPDDDFQLTSVNLQYNRDLTDDGLANLQDCRHLTYFKCTYTGIGDDGLVHLQASAPVLQELHLPGGVTDVGLANFAECRELTRLTLHGVKATSAGLASFRHCKKLTSLSLGGIGLGGVSLASFAGCTELEHLNLRNTALAPAELTHFNDCTKLKTLDLSGNSAISNQDFGYFKNCRDLTSLNLAYANVDDQALSFLSRCRELSYLNVAETRVSETFLESLQEKLPNCKIDRTPRWPSPAGREHPQPAVAPFVAEQAKRHQQGWADELGLDVDYTNEMGMKFRLIPPGKFKMGSVQGDPNEKPIHDVTLTKPFYIGVYEVLQDEYEEVVSDNPSKFDGERLPVEFVTSEEAAAYCVALSKKTGQTYRLPTEAEWEFACRAGTDTPWSFGDDPDDLPDYAWCKENGEGKTHPVGQKKPNAFGLYDMHGNVFEYCSDFTAGYTDEAAVDPQGPKFGRYRGFRGGSWFFSLYHSRSANRQDKQWPARGTHVGFRVVLGIDNNAN